MKRRDLLSAPLALPLPLLAQPAEAELPTLLRERLRLEGVGLAAARVLPDGSVQLAAEGRSGKGTEALNAERHRFEIGSVTKTFTGLLLADAVQRGAVKLDTAVEDLLPDGLKLRDKAEQPLRLVDLATHRSGLPRLPSPFEPEDMADPYADFDEPRLLEALKSFRAARGRDEAFEYSNFGMGLLAWALARQAKQSLAALLDRRILAPLGLGGSAGMQLQLRPMPAQDLAKGHDPAGHPVPAWHFAEPMAGAGALQASSAQMARYAQAMLGLFEHPLQDALGLALQRHSDLGPAPRVGMGLGWMLVHWKRQRLANHDGNTAGFSAALWLNLDTKRAGLVLGNAAGNVGDLARHLMDASAPLRDIAAERRERALQTQQTALPLSAEQAAALAGVYALSPKFKLTLRADGRRLLAQATGQGEFELFAKAERQFFARVTALEVHFDEGMPPPAFTLLQAGQRLRFLRE